MPGNTPMRLAAAAAVLVLLILSACTPFGIAEGASTMITDKTVTDHIISWTSGKNCSSVRYTQGMTYCEEDEPNPAPNVYCYRTLGDISCYERPDPYDGSYRKVGDNDHNLKHLR